MKALISAAGMGYRMGDLTKNINKCALKINGIPIIERLVNSLEQIGINEIYIIVGYQQQKIRDILKDRVIYLENNDYKSTGILTSILQSKEVLINSDFLFMTGDSVMDISILEAIIKNDLKDYILISVDEKECDEEDCKVVMKGDKFIAISKKVDSDDVLGEFTGLVRVNQKLAKPFFEEIENYIGSDDTSKILGDVLVVLQTLGYNVALQTTESYYRTEIDFQSDLNKAKKDIIINNL